jgi:hypothetical protein
MRRWRGPLLFSAVILLAQLAHRSPLVDVVSGGAPADARLVYPLPHVVFAPFTLLADWLNGGGTQELKGFVLWSVAIFVIARLAVDGPAGGKAGTSARARSRARREAVAAAVFVLNLVLFVGWAAYLTRPVPRLVVDNADLVVFDIHSHTQLSHDGRRGFGAERNAAWHARTGFDAAFVTDHNRFGAANQWRIDAPRRPPRLLDGEELSLSGLHLIVLGNAREIDNSGYNGSWDSTGALIRRLAGLGAPPDTPHPTPHTPFLIASLPEYWRSHWGPDIADLVRWGVGGFEIWTTSPRAMDIPEPMRRAVIARCRLGGLTMFGATDMHGLGNTASVWNVTRVPGWRAMSDSGLTAALLATFRARGADANRVLAIRRWMPASRLGRAVAVPVNVALLTRSASHWHAVALVGWIWLVVVVLKSKKLEG